MKAFVVLSCVLAVAVATYVPADTPEVAAAKAQHLAAHQEARARNWAGDVVVNQWAAAAPAWNAVWAARAGHWYAPTWSQWASPVVVNGHVQDTPEVAAEKAKHLSLVAATRARDAAAGEYIEAAPVAHAAIPATVVVANGHVQDTPEVVAEKAKHFALVAEAQARNAVADNSEWADNAVNWQAWGAPAAVHTYAAVAPVVSRYAAVPAVAAIPAVAAEVHSQYHAQDEAGQYSYGYAGGLSTKNEQKTIDGVTRGAFSYVDANGLVQSRSYVADPVNGFRVAATDLPQGPAPVAAAAPVVAAPILAAPAAHIVSAAAPVVINADGHLAETPEVVAAKAAHFAAHAQEHVRLAQAEH